MKLKTEYWPKPIPLRYFDWQAWDSDSYDGAPDSGHVAHIVGHGATEADAIEEWRHKWAEAHGADDWNEYAAAQDDLAYARQEEDAERKRDAAEYRDD